VSFNPAVKQDGATEMRVVSRRENDDLTCARWAESEIRV